MLARRVLLTALGWLVIVPTLTAYAKDTQAEYYLKEWNDFRKACSNLTAAQTQAYSVYQELVNYSGKRFTVVTHQSWHWGEAHPGGLIVLDASIMAKPKAILAFVFAHEWGHEALGHQPNIYSPAGSSWRIRQTPTMFEDEADTYAGKFLKSRGYDIKVVASWLRSLPKSPPGDTHSDGDIRAGNVFAAYNGTTQDSKPALKTQVACQHQIPCQHTRPCQHQIPCVHQVACVHTGPCIHTMPCTHSFPCQHPVMTPYGLSPMHPFDTAHAFDTSHMFDSAHLYDMPHTFDIPHQFDTQHQYDVAHPYDLI